MYPSENVAIELTMTDVAHNHFTEQLLPNAQQWADEEFGPDSGSVLIRFGIKGGGCSGFSYIIEFAHTTEVIPDVDKVFAMGKVNCVVDGISYRYLRGSTIDYIPGPIAGGQFHFENPNAESTCSCGNSFSI